MPARIDTAMVLAAGLGTRMRPLTDDRPKPMVTVAGRPLIDHTLDRIDAAGIPHVVVNIHYQPDSLVRHLIDASYRFAVDLSDERAQLMETGGGLVQAARAGLLRGDPILSVNSDNIWIDGAEPAIERLAQCWDAARMDALLLLVPRAHAYCHAGPGDFILDDEGRVRRRDGASAPLVFTGVQLVAMRLLRDPPDGPFSTNVLWDRAIGEGRLFGLVHDGDWFDIGTPAAIPVVEAALADG